jgi:hypothetical protein
MSDSLADYVVHTDRAALARWHGGILATHAVLTLLVLVVALWAYALTGSVAVSLAPLIVLAGEIFQLALHAYLYGARSSISEPLRLAPGGFTMSTPLGRLEVPWDAVQSIGLYSRFFSRVFVFRLHPAAGPGSPGVHTDVPARGWARMRRSGGPMLGERGIDRSLDEVLAVVRQLTDGRIPVA